MHKKGKVVNNDSQPNKEMMLSTEVDSHLLAVAEAATAQEAIAFWQPGSVQSIPLKRLQPGSKSIPGSITITGNG